MGQKIAEMDISGFVISPVQNTAGYRLAKNVSLVSWRFFFLDKLAIVVLNNRSSYLPGLDVLKKNKP